MILVIAVLFFALGLLWLERLWAWFEDADEYIRRCFRLGLDRAWGRVVGHELCPCALVCRAIYGVPAPLGWLPTEWQVGLSGRASDLCLAIEDRVSEGSRG